MTAFATPGQTALCSVCKLTEQVVLYISDLRRRYDRKVSCMLKDFSVKRCFGFHNQNNDNCSTWGFDLTGVVVTGFVPDGLAGLEARGSI